MFEQGTYAPTYSGPILSSGEPLRRGRNAGMAMSAFAGNQRGLRKQVGGIGAGSKLSEYTTGIASDTEAAKGFAAAQKAYADNMSSNADARLQYQTNRSQEESGIRSLLLNRSQADQASELDLRDLGIGIQLQNRQRQVDNERSRLARRASTGGILMGLFS